jgi:hypothetical protein
MSAVLHRPCAAFAGDRRIAAGPLAEVALALRGATGSLLVFDDATGQVIDLDLRGSPDEVLARLPALAAAFPDGSPETTADGSAAPRGRGRPRLGVVAREVTLLPRHWAWLATQPGGASVALRRLVDQARRDSVGEDAARAAREAAYRAMAALAGDRPGFEAAARALFAGDGPGFTAAVAAWPKDIGAYLTALAGLQPAAGARAREGLQAKSPGE